jgi:2'-5' RNA ligase
MEIIGVLSLLEDAPYHEIRKLWKLIQRRYHSKGVQSFSHPNITFQGGKTNRLQELERGFSELALRIKPFEIHSASLGDFDRNVIYVRVRKDHDLARVNRLVNTFLNLYCEELFESYCPTRWVPHITLAMEDLTERDFEAAMGDLGNRGREFSQTIHNICLVRKCTDERIRIVRKLELGETSG